jgi:hypothetical protein
VSLHVVIAATHTFDDTLMGCLVQKNVNPIEHVERSLLIMGSVLHGISPVGLLRENQVARMKELDNAIYAMKRNREGAVEESEEVRLIA